MATKEDLLNRAEFDYKVWRENSGDYQSRFCFELVELQNRVSNLDNFLQNKPLPGGLDEDKHRKNLLQLQLQIMRAYLEVLKMRYDNDKL